MLARREKCLLLVLCAAAGLCTLGIAVDLGVDRLETARAQARRYQVQVLKLAQALRSEEELTARRGRLTNEITRLQKKFYSRSEMNPFVFGTIVGKKLASRGIAVSRYQVIEQKGMGNLEVTASASIGSLILFLRDVSDYERYWAIPSLSLTMKEDGTAVDVQFRIAYETFDF